MDTGDSVRLELIGPVGLVILFDLIKILIGHRWLETGHLCHCVKIQSLPTPKRFTLGMF